MSPAASSAGRNSSWLAWLFGFLVFIAVLFAGYTWVMLTWSYSQGERAGYVQKFSHKGWICKTWEGELAMVTMPGTVAEKFAFSVRDAAVAGVRQADGSWLVAPPPSLADARDQDLRDTAVTWLARAGCTIPEIGAITGHSSETIHAILKHYLVQHPELAENAMQKLVTWYDKPAQQAR